MTAKEYLSQARFLDDRINSKYNKYPHLTSLQQNAQPQFRICHTVSTAVALQWLTQYVKLSICRKK